MSTTCDNHHPDLPSLQKWNCIDLPPSETPTNTQFLKNDSMMDTDCHDMIILMDCDNSGDILPDASCNAIMGGVSNAEAMDIAEDDPCNSAGDYSPLTSLDLLSLPNKSPSPVLSDTSELLWPSGESGERPVYESQLKE